MTLPGKRGAHPSGSLGRLYEPPGSLLLLQESHMTTLREYQCNFCKNRIKCLNPETQEMDGIGFYWANDNKLVQRRLHEVENHLCRACVEAFDHFFRVDHEH